MIAFDGARRSGWALLAYGFALLPVLACDGGRGSAPSASTGSAPPSVVVHADTLVSGFASGTMRKGYEMASFRIAKYPTTVGEYRECVAHGACTVPESSAPECLSRTGASLMERPTYDVAAGEKLPLTCATVAQAAAYCAWVGGSLPTAEQWLLAARGTQVTRNVWGDDPPACAQHPAVMVDPHGAPCAIGDASEIARYAVGTHPAGASQSGAEDMLLAKGELLAVSADAHFPSCAPPQVGCMALSRQPGSLDTYRPIARSPEGGEIAASAAAFRCVFSKEQP